MNGTAVCIVCTSAHIVIAKASGFLNQQISEIRKGSISFNVNLNILARLTKEVLSNKGAVTEETLDEFYAAGFTDEHLVDLLLVIAGRTFSNYLNAIVKLPIDFPVAEEVSI